MYQEAILHYTDPKTHHTYNVLIHRDVVKEHIGTGVSGHGGWTAYYVRDEGFEFLEKVSPQTLICFTELYETGKLIELIEALFSSWEG